MSKNVDFEIGTIVTDEFLDSVQELLTGTVQNARLAPGTASDRVSLALSGDTMFDKRGSVNIEGRYCFFDVAKDSLPASSGNGSRNVYLSTTANGTTKQPNFNITVDTAPPVASYVKRIGIVDKNGSALSDARMVTGVQADHEQYNHFTFRSVFDSPNETILTVEGQSNQTSTAGVLYDSDVSSAPTRAISLGENGNEHLYLDTAGRIVFVDDGTGSGDIGLQFTTHGAESVLTTNHEFSSHIAGIGAESFSARVIDTDVDNRIVIYNDGEICWGDGTNPPDVCLLRLGPDELTLDTGDKIYMDYTIIKATDGPDLLTNKEYVDTEVAGAISESKRFAFFITP